MTEHMKGDSYFSIDQAIAIYISLFDLHSRKNLRFSCHDPFEHLQGSPGSDGTPGTPGNNGQAGSDGRDGPTGSPGVKVGFISVCRLIFLLPSLAALCGQIIVWCSIDIDLQW